MKKDVIVAVTGQRLTWFENPEGEGQYYTSPQSRKDGSLAIPPGWSGFLYLLDQQDEPISTLPIQVEYYRKGGLVKISAPDPEGKPQDTVTESLRKDEDQLALQTILGIMILLTREERSEQI